MSDSSIAMSVVLLMPMESAGIAHTVRSLRAQTAVAQLELVVVGASQEQLQIAVASAQEPCRLPNGDLAGDFAAVQAVQFSRMGSLPAARAAGAEAARGDVIGFAEDHCFPEPGWAAALLEAHKQDVGITGPRMACANPASTLSWVCLALHFGTAAIPGAQGESSAAPSHNSTFKRDVLFAAGQFTGGPASSNEPASHPDPIAAIEDGMEMEYLFQQRITASGIRAWQESRAVTRHVNASRLLPAMTHALVGGWLYAAKRCTAENWGLGRKLVQILLSPLVVAAQLKRKLPILRALPRPRPPVWKMLPLALLLITLHTLGELWGSIVGLRDVVLRYSNYEHSRARFVRREEVALLLPEVPS